MFAEPTDDVRIPCTIDGKITVTYKLRNAIYSSSIAAGAATNFSNFFKIVNPLPVEASTFVASIPGGIGDGTTRTYVLANLDIGALPKDTPHPYSLRVDIGAAVPETNESDNTFGGGSIRFARCP